MTSNNETVSRQNLWAGNIAKNLWRPRVTMQCYPRILTVYRLYSKTSSYITNHFKTGPSGNSKYCFLRISRCGGFQGGSLKTLEGFRGGTTQICLENEDMGGGIVKVIKNYYLGLLQWRYIQRGDPLNFTMFSPKSPHPPTHNDQSLTVSLVTSH